MTSPACLPVTADSSSADARAHAASTSARIASWIALMALRSAGSSRKRGGTARTLADRVAIYFTFLPRRIGRDDIPHPDAALTLPPRAGRASSLDRIRLNQAHDHW